MRMLPAALSPKQNTLLGRAAPSVTRRGNAKVSPRQGWRTNQDSIKFRRPRTTARQCSSSSLLVRSKDMRHYQWLNPKSATVTTTTSSSTAPFQMGDNNVARLCLLCFLSWNFGGVISSTCPAHHKSNFSVVVIDHNLTGHILLVLLNISPNGPFFPCLRWKYSYQPAPISWPR